MKFKEVNEEELIGAKVVSIYTQNTVNVYPSVILEKDGKTYEICGELLAKVKVREVIDRRGANGELFSKGDYIEGTEHVGIPGVDLCYKRVRGWVGEIYEETNRMYIQADDGYKGARGTTVELSTAIKLDEQKPRPTKVPNY